MFTGTPEPTMYEELKTGAELQVTLCNWPRIALSTTTTTSEGRFRIEITCGGKGTSYVRKPLGRGTKLSLLAAATALSLTCVQLRNVK